MSNFHVGQHVVYIGKGRGVVCKPLKPGRVYTVRMLAIALDGMPVLYVEEVRNRLHSNGRELAYMRSKFRPLKKLKVEDFTSVDEPIKENAL